MIPGTPHISLQISPVFQLTPNKLHTWNLQSSCWRMMGGGGGIPTSLTQTQGCPTEDKGLAIQEPAYRKEIPGTLLY